MRGSARQGQIVVDGVAIAFPLGTGEVNVGVGT